MLSVKNICVKYSYKTVLKDVSINFEKGKIYALLGQNGAGKSTLAHVICGGASQGVISSAVNAKIYISWFDDSGFSRAPGTIIGSSTVNQEKMAYLITKEFFEGKTPWGTAKMVGMQDGFIDFIQDDELYIKAVPEDIRQKMKTLVQDIISGNFKIQ